MRAARRCVHWHMYARPSSAWWDQVVIEGAVGCWEEICLRGSSIRNTLTNTDLRLFSDFRMSAVQDSCVGFTGVAGMHHKLQQVRWGVGEG